MLHYLEQIHVLDSMTYLEKEVPRTLLLQATKRASIFSSKSTHQVKLEIKGNSLKISACKNISKIKLGIAIDTLVVGDMLDNFKDKGYINVLTKEEEFITQSDKKGVKIFGSFDDSRKDKKFNYSTIIFISDQNLIEIITRPITT